MKTEELLNGKILNHWSIFQSKAATWSIIIITLILIFFEATYNVDLLNTLSDPNADGSKVTDLSERGKLLAAIGISWALGKNLLYRVNPAAFGVLAFVGLVSATYYSLDYTYTKVISDLRPEVKVMGFNLFSYRNDLLTGRLIDPDIPLPKDEPVLGKIFMGAFPLVLLDDRFMVPAQDVVERKANDKSNSILATAKDQWPEYSKNMGVISTNFSQYVDTSNRALGRGLENDWASYNRNMQNLAKSHSEFIDGSRKASGAAATDKDWSAYRVNMDALQSAHAEFISGSMKAARYGPPGIKQFRSQSGGLEPDAGLTRDQFVRMLRGSNHPKGRELRNSESRVVGRYPDGKPIYGSEIPYFMNRSGFMEWFAAKARTAMRATGFDPNPNLNRMQFVDMLRKSKNSRGDDLRAAEARQIGKRSDDSPVYGKDVPYFMTREQFIQWFAIQSKETLSAKGFLPDPGLTQLQFVEMLRSSKSKEGENLRTSESREIGRLPSGASLYARDLPYFMSHNDYVKWFAQRASEAINTAMPTRDNVEKFGKIKEVNAAIFLPPMAIISSLTSALTNGISLLIIVPAILLSKFKQTSRLASYLQRLSIPLMVSAVALLLFMMPEHVFTKGTPIFDLETQLHEHVGVAGKVWSKLSNLQKFVL